MDQNIREFAGAGMRRFRRLVLDWTMMDACREFGFKVTDISSVENGRECSDLSAEDYAAALRREHMSRLEQVFGDA